MICVLPFVASDVFKEGYVSMVVMGHSLGHSAGQLCSKWNVDPEVLIS